MVTGFNLFRHRSFSWDTMWGNVLPRAFASDMGLSTIWDPENGGSPMAGDFALVNLYIGGGFTCMGANSTPA